METATTTAWLILLLIVETGFLFMIINMGGKLLKAKLKSMLPWNKNKGRFWLHLYQTGTFVLDYIKLDKENKIKRKNNDILITGDSHHSFVDKTALENHVSIHKMDKLPLVLTVEGTPTDILAKYRNFELDLNKLGTIEKYLTKVIESDNLNKLKEANTKMLKLFNDLKNSFVYLPPAKEMCRRALMLFDENEVYSNKGYVRLLNKYKLAVQHLQRMLNERNNKFVNFSEFFSKGNMSKLLNEVGRRMFSLGRQSVGDKPNAMDKAVKIGGTIFLLAAGIIVYFLVDQGNQIEDMTNKLNQINKKLDNDIIVGSDANTGEGSPSPSSSPVPNGDLSHNTSYQPTLA